MIAEGRASCGEITSEAIGGHGRAGLPSNHRKRELPTPGKEDILSCRAAQKRAETISHGHQKLVPQRKKQGLIL